MDTVFATKNITNILSISIRLLSKSFIRYLKARKKLTGGFAIKYDDRLYISQEAMSDDVLPWELSTLLEADL